MFNAEATREARERREMERGHAGWGEQRRRREERERERGGWGRR